MTETPLPLCVDLDGTLILTDTTAEALFGLLKENPFHALQVTKWLRSGAAVSKHNIAVHASLIVELLPYNNDLIEWLKKEKESGRRLYLATGSNKKFADIVADHLGIFDDVIASTNDNRMSGGDKARALNERFGRGQFAYAGNAPIDLDVWKDAGEAIVVNASQRTIKRAQSLGNVSRVIGKHGLPTKTFLKAIRWHQWAKNLLIFVPMLTAHELTNGPIIAKAIIAFISFSALASTVYLMNDLLDLPADRQNVYKRHRPLASGKMTILAALVSAIMLAIISFGLTTLLPMQFFWLLLLYAILNLLYSLKLKRVAGIDVLLITSLYVLRLLAGGAATSIQTSIWLFVFAALIFLSLALIKRVSEIVNLEKNGETKTAGRGYTVHHKQALTIIGSASGYLSLAVLALYIKSPAVVPLYTIPVLLWLLVPIFGVWLYRTWRITQAGGMHEDPTAFAAKDWFSYATALTAIIIIFLAT